MRSIIKLNKECFKNKRVKDYQDFQDIVDKKVKGTKVKSEEIKLKKAYNIL